MSGKAIAVILPAMAAVVCGSILIAHSGIDSAACADFDGDGLVDYQDLADLADNWLSPDSAENTADLNGDGATNLEDFAGFASQWQKGCRIDLYAIESSIILEGNATIAYRDPAVIYHDGVFGLFYTYVRHEPDLKIYYYTAFSKSRDLVNWTEPNIITPRDLNKNFASPGNIIRYGDQWILCLQTYPTPNGEKYGTDDARVWKMRSDDLETWSEAEILMVKGPDVALENMGRLIDAYLVEDKAEPGKWWCFFDDDAANMSYSYDLETWTYFNRINSGENACVLIDNDEYLLFHSPRNGIGMKRSSDLVNWRDVGELITLGQHDWSWAQGRLTAGFVLDLRHDPRVGKYLLFFHGTGPEGENVVFNNYACISLAWSDDLVNWDWPKP